VYVVYIVIKKVIIFNIIFFQHQFYYDFENHIVDSMILYVVYYIIICDIHQLNKLIFLLTDEVFTTKYRVFRLWCEIDFM
jgi:hypothetical protein